MLISIIIPKQGNIGNYVLNRNLVFAVIIKRVNTSSYTKIGGYREVNYTPELLYVMKIWYWFISKWLNVYRGPFIKDVINQERWEGFVKFIL